MANSLEVRNPYVDYRLMEFSYNLPEHFKINNGTPKYLMKKLLERYLPMIWCIEEMGFSGAVR
jgi:asparagine synthase (glutamine-hydrolysing)